MDREIDKKVIKDDRMRIVNIHEIGSNTRDKQEHSEMKFEADADEPKAGLLAVILLVVVHRHGRCACVCILFYFYV